MFQQSMVGPRPSATLKAGRPHRRVAGRFLITLAAVAAALVAVPALAAPSQYILCKAVASNGDALLDGGNFQLSANATGVGNLGSYTPTVSEGGSSCDAAQPFPAGGTDLVVNEVAQPAGWINAPLYPRWTITGSGLPAGGISGNGATATLSGANFAAATGVVTVRVTNAKARRITICKQVIDNLTAPAAEGGTFLFTYSSTSIASTALANMTAAEGQTVCTDGIAGRPQPAALNIGDTSFAVSENSATNPFAGSMAPTYPRVVLTDSSGSQQVGGNGSYSATLGNALLSSTSGDLIVTFQNKRDAPSQVMVCQRWEDDAVGPLQPASSFAAIVGGVGATGSPNRSVPLFSSAAPTASNGGAVAEGGVERCLVVSRPSSETYSTASSLRLPQNFGAFAVGYPKWEMYSAGACPSTVTHSGADAGCAAGTLAAGRNNGLVANPLIASATGESVEIDWAAVPPGVMPKIVLVIKSGLFGNGALPNTGNVAQLCKEVLDDGVAPTLSGNFSMYLHPYGQAPRGYSMGNEGIDGLAAQTGILAEGSGITCGIGGTRLALPNWLTGAVAQENVWGGAGWPGNNGPVVLTLRPAAGGNTTTPASPMNLQLFTSFFDSWRRAGLNLGAGLAPVDDLNVIFTNKPSSPRRVQLCMKLVDNGLNGNESNTWAFTSDGSMAPLALTEGGPEVCQTNYVYPIDDGVTPPTVSFTVSPVTPHAGYALGYPRGEYRWNGGPLTAAPASAFSTLFASNGRFSIIIPASVVAEQPSGTLKFTAVMQMSQQLRLCKQVLSNGNTIDDGGIFTLTAKSNGAGFDTLDLSRNLAVTETTTGPDGIGLACTVANPGGTGQAGIPSIATYLTSSETQPLGWNNSPGFPQWKATNGAGTVIASGVGTTVPVNTVLRQGAQTPDGPIEQGNITITFLNRTGGSRFMQVCKQLDANANPAVITAPFSLGIASNDPATPTLISSSQTVTEGQPYTTIGNCSSQVEVPVLATTVTGSEAVPANWPALGGNAAGFPQWYVVDAANTPIAGLSGTGANTGPINLAAITSPDFRIVFRNQADAAAPTVAKAFAPASIPVNGTSTVTLTLTNTSATNPAVLTAAFTDALPAGLSYVAGTAATSCGNGNVSVAGSNVTLASGATIAAGGSCTVTFNVTSAVPNTVAPCYLNSLPIGALQTGLGSNAAAASASLCVSPPPTGSITVSKTVLDGPVPVPAYSGFGVFATCNLPSAGTRYPATGTVSVGTSAPGTISAIPAGAICTVTENGATSPAPPLGFSWSPAIGYSQPAAIVGGGSVAASVTNRLLPLPLQTCTPQQQRASERWWHFGNRGVIDFATSGSIASASVNPSAINVREGTTVVSDDDGNLLFWAGAPDNASLNVYNRNQQPMPNGSGLTANNSAVQAVVAFPAVDVPGRYFVVSNTGNVTAHGTLYYSVVDMALDGGRGDVVAGLKNIQLGTANTTSEAITAVPNADGSGFWVLTYPRGAAAIRAYEFDNDGPVTGNAVITTLSTANYTGWGTLYFNAKLDRLLQLTTLNNNSYLRVLKFNASTGQAVEEFTIPLSYTGLGSGHGAYAADFSPSGDYLYVSRIAPARLTRYRLAGATNVASILASVEEIGLTGAGASGTGSYGGHVRRAPDGRMYIANQTGDGTNQHGASLNVVNNPDAATAAGVGYVLHGFALPAPSGSRLGLPQMVTGCPLASDIDYGDAPDSYGTLVASGGASHQLSGYVAATSSAPLMLGSKVDSEFEGYPGPNADGDDLAVPIDDEDALAGPLLLTPGSTSVTLAVPVTNTSGVAATLYAWIDFNGNGRFDAAELATAPVAPAATSANLSWSGLNALPAGFSSYLRLRLTSTALFAGTASNGGDARAVGPANNGEVEDHRVQTVPLLTLVKTVTNDSGGAATLANFALTATGPTTITGVSGSAAVTAALVTAGSYTLSETNLPGYTAGAWSCIGGSLSGSTLTLANSQTAICTINNDDQPATLTLVKTVTNDDGGVATISSFPLTATGPTTITGVSGTASVTAAAVSAGTYALSEINVAGYVAGAWSCVGGTLTGSSLALTSGQSATCTINNNDQPATLTLVKTVTNDNGGSATIADFALTATGPTTITGVSGTAAVSAVAVSAGSYALSEVNAAGYSAGAWTRVGGTLTGSSLALSSGQSATCTINNNDQAATLTLVKTITNDNGGIATVADFPLTATGPTTISGVSGTPAVTAVAVSAGSYALSEVNLAGYTAGAWSCTGGTLTGSNLSLTSGQSAACTINNDDQGATLTLVKTVTNDNGGVATIADFPLTANGPSAITGVSGTPAVTAVAVSAGTYVLSELNLAGYTAGAWSCTSGTLTGSSLALASGQSATCTINNNDQGATLTLVKTVTNDNGGVATISDFALTATGPTTITGVSGTPAVTSVAVAAGNYVLSETNLSGYSAGAWSCTAGALTGTTLVLANGQSATCTINNDDQAATLTLVKTVTNDNGGVATVSSFPLTATGPTTITGVTGTPAVTAVAVSAGSYALSEVNLAGYVAGAWSCVGGTLTGSSVTLASGQSATCTINNNDIAPNVTLVKALTGESGAQTGIAEPGETLTYTITLANSTATAFAGYDFVENVPAGATLTSVSGTGVTACVTPVAGAGTCAINVASVPANGSTTVTVVFTVASPIPVGITQIANTVTGGDTTCTVPGNTCTVITPVAAILSVSKAVSAESISSDGVAQPGEAITYTITVRNHGGTPANGVLVNERVPANTSFVSGTPSWTCAAGAVAGSPCNTLVDVPAASGAMPGVVTATFTVRVVDPIPLGVTQIANVVALNDQPPVDCSANPTAPQCAVLPTINVGLSKTVLAVTPTGPNSYVVKYQIDIVNSGGSIASYTLTDTLGFASGVSFNGPATVATTGGTLNAALAGGNYTPANGTVQQLSASPTFLPIGASHRYTVSVPIAVNVGSVSAGACTGAAGNGLFNQANITGSFALASAACAPVSGDAVRIALAKTVRLQTDANHNGYGDVGDVLGYTFVISNPGNVTLSAIQLIDPRVSDISCAATTGEGTALTILRSDTIAVHPFEGLGDLAAGDTMTCTATYTLTAADVANRRVVNVATTTGSGPSGQVATATGTAIFAQFR